MCFLITYFQVIEETLEIGQTTLWFESVVDQVLTWLNIFFQHLLLFLEIIPDYFSRCLDSFLLAINSVEELSIEVFSSVFTSSTEVFSSVFTDFQVRLLQLLLVILFIHLIAIYIAWSKYSTKITERFLKTGQSPLTLTEDLRIAVSELKLPLEHTPRL